MQPVPRSDQLFFSSNAFFEPRDSLNATCSHLKRRVCPRENSAMTDSIMYHDGNRRLQDRFDSRRISDRLEEKLTRTHFANHFPPFRRGPRKHTSAETHV